MNRQKAAASTAAPAEISIPSRHGLRFDEARRMLAPLRWFMGCRDPGPARWQAIGEALMQGDAPMDALLDWMCDYGLARARPLFEQAATRGIASLRRPPAALKRFFTMVEARPDWVDEDLLRLGAQVVQRGGVSATYLGRDLALVGGYQASAFNRTLLLTGALQKGPGRRFAETLQWALDCTAEAGLAPLGIGYTSTLRVRLVHALVRRHVAALPQWRMDAWGLPINQTDMAATMIGIYCVPGWGARLLGIATTRRERDAVAHLSRYVGWLMGVEDRWLPADDAEAAQLLYEISLSITNPDETSRQLAQPMVDEPLLRQYGRFGWLRGRIERSRHLSISRVFLGREGMRNLGLPTRVLPWYPAVALPMNLSRQLRARLLPGGLDWQARTGRAEQEAFLHEVAGAEPVQVGAAAQKHFREQAA